MVVPVVGDFGGPSAIRAVGAYLKAHDAVVSAFYLSNVEQYLNQDGKEDTFLCNVSALPLDDTSTFIFTGAGPLRSRIWRRRSVRPRRRRWRPQHDLPRPMKPDADSCDAR